MPKPGAEEMRRKMWVEHLAVVLGALLPAYYHHFAEAGHPSELDLRWWVFWRPIPLHGIRTWWGHPGALRKLTPFYSG